MDIPNLFLSLHKQNNKVMTLSTYTKRLEKVQRLRTYALQDRNHVKISQANHLIHKITQAISNLTKPTYTLKCTLG